MNNLLTLASRLCLSADQQQPDQIISAAVERFDCLLAQLELYRDFCMSIADKKSGSRINSALKSEAFKLCVVTYTHPESAIADLYCRMVDQLIPRDIRVMAERIVTQNNRITQDPLFCVMQVRAEPTDENCHYDFICWGDMSSGEYTRIDPDSDKWHRLEALHQAGRDIDDDKYQRNAMVNRDVFVTASLTEAGAQAHINMNGHNLKKPFIYATSLFRTPDMIALRDWLKDIGTGTTQRPDYPQPVREAIDLKTKIDSFKDQSFFAGAKFELRGKTYDLAAIDFQEALVAYSVDDDEDLKWARWENITLIDDQITEPPAGHEEVVNG